MSARVMSETGKGILCILGAAFSFALMNLFVKMAGPEVPTFEKAFFRNAIAIIAAGAMLIKQRPKLVLTKETKECVFARAFFGTIALMCNFYAIDHLNISDASMLNKLSPFFAIIFSYFILKERVAGYQAAAVIVAILGAVVILRPGMNGVVAFPALIGFISGISAGLAYTLLRRATNLGMNGNFIVFVFSVFSCIACVPFLFIRFKMLSYYEFGMLLLAGCSATCGQYCITAAYTHAPAKSISVFDYTQIIFAGLLGFFVLGEVPDIFSIAGYIVIIGAGIFMYAKEIGISSAKTC
ncbi:MAG: DMT family transporter [Lachnospiraceae bacterium]|jgi:drug/metabolite transporter (DMT)-like permease|nr:DMT family transporter [Lachnospiraceae bacterium]MEE3461931.1 DMT family transporter [Lachnospiraceae bacterium]